MVVAVSMGATAVQWAHLLQEVPDAQAAQMRSQRGTFSMAWTATAPMDAATTMTNAEVAHGVTYALGLSHEPSATLPGRCYCGCAFTHEHAVSCAPTVQLARHNLLPSNSGSLRGPTRESAWTSLSGREERGAELEPDAALWLPGSTIWIDVSCTNGSLGSHKGKAAFEEGAANAKREKTKFNRYGEEAKRRGSSFLPLLFETLGRQGPGVVHFTRALASTSIMPGALSVSEMLTRFSVMLVKGNALVAFEVLSRARRAQNSTRGAARREGAAASR